MTRHICNIHLIAGTRPNIIKVAPLYKVLSQQGWCRPRLVFVEQHNSPNMSTEIFEDFGITDTQPIALKAQGYGPRVGEIIEKYQDYCGKDRPDLVVVFGDVDVSVAVALAAKRLELPVVHLEAGLRSGDMAMPEEINRMVIDAVCDILLAPSEDALNNLSFGEAKPAEKVEFVGNIMIDSLKDTVKPALQAEMLATHALTAKAFAVATFHRPSNVDAKKPLERICDLLTWLGERIPVFFPAHPRTLKQLQHFKLDAKLHDNPAIQVVPALRYASFVNLVAASAFVLTDSGGIQEETTWLGVPCLTFRDTTERPVTVRAGTNSLVNEFDIHAQLERVLADLARGAPHAPANIPLWDGATAFRCAAVLYRWWLQRLKHPKIAS